MKKLDEVSKKIEKVSKAAEEKVKETVLPKVKGLESLILAVMLVMLLAGLVSGTGLMIVAGVLTAVILGLPMYLKKVEGLVEKAKKKTVKKEEKKEVKETKSSKKKDEEKTEEDK